MSRYATVQTQFKDAAALVDALMETGQWTQEQVEVHCQPQHLFGYAGDMRSETATIIIRKRFVGSASNDMGFSQNVEGNYEAIISEYDQRKYGKEWVGELKGNYAFHKLRRDQEARGRRVSRTRLPNGRQRVEIRGYR